MISRLIFVASLLTLSLLLSSCRPSNSPLPATQKSGDISVRLDVAPAPPVPMQDALLELTLSDSMGQPISGAVVSLDLTMPAMEMPVNRPAVIESSPGTYQAKTLFTMAGEWRIRVVVDFGDKRESFAFDLNTRE